MLNVQTIAPTPPVAIAIEPLLLDAKKTARLLGISRSKFYSMHSAGLVPMPISLVGSVRWNLSELRSWVQAGCPSRLVWQATKERQR